MNDASHPIDGQIVLMAGAQASVTLTHLSELVSDAHEFVSARCDEYDRQYERIDDPSGPSFYLVGPSYWEDVGAALGLSEREVDAVRRTHTLQFERAGRRLGRLDEFETAMEIRDVVVTAGAPSA